MPMRHHASDMTPRPSPIAWLIAPALLAYALYLEDDARYEEALDVLETTLQVGGDRLRVADAVAATLRLARVNRKLTRFSDAETAYVHAGQLAAAASDGYAVLLSRIGLAGASQGRGNLAEAERCYREKARAPAGGPCLPVLSIGFTARGRRRRCSGCWRR